MPKCNKIKNANNTMNMNTNFDTKLLVFVNPVDATPVDATPLKLLNPPKLDVVVVVVCVGYNELI